MDGAHKFVEKEPSSPSPRNSNGPLLESSPKTDGEESPGSNTGSILTGSDNASPASASSIDKIMHIDMGSPFESILTDSDNASPASASSIDKIMHIDTGSPFESVKAAVSKYGGIVDWKAHRAYTIERRKVIEQELEKVYEEMPVYKKNSEDAEKSKQEVLTELENAKRLIEELKVDLERVQKEEEQAKQDFELAKLRVSEMEQGIVDESSIAAKAQVEVAKVRHEAAVSELKTVKDELNQLKQDYDLLIDEKDVSMKKTEEAISRSKEVEKSVEDLTIELITLKESLESVQAAHMEAEEHRAGTLMAKEQDVLNWERELKQAEEDVERVSQELSVTRDLKSKLGTATKLLQDLKAELAAYMGVQSEQGSNEEGNFQNASKGTRGNVEAALAAGKQELEQVNLNIVKATDEVSMLMEAAASLKSKLEIEKAELAAIQQREGMASIAVTSLEAELRKTKSEISCAQEQEKEQREKLVELPNRLQVVAQGADQAKELEKNASDELRKAREEAEQAKAVASTMESRLRAVQKEIEAAKASEKLALASINALVESESIQKSNDEDSPRIVTMSFEEYYELSKKAQEAEEQANARVATALSQIDVAKDSELKSLKKLEEANCEKTEIKETLQIALQKSEKAVEGKLSAEQELREWRAENEQRRKAGDTVSSAKSSNISPKGFDETFETMSLASAPPITAAATAVEQKPAPSLHRSRTDTNVKPEAKTPKKKKKFPFQKIFTFLGKKKRSKS